LRDEGRNEDAREYVADWHKKRGEKPPFMKIREKKKD
jgi:hypothetical protein